MGTYNGDGTGTPKTISLSFTPSMVIIMQVIGCDLVITTNGTNALWLDTASIPPSGEASTTTSVYITAGGFVVGDGSSGAANNSTQYQYLAFEQAGEIIISWKNTRQTLIFGQYTGDGTTTGREINLGAQADLVFIQRNGQGDFWFTMNDVTSAQTAPSLATPITTQNAVHTSAGGFTVGDGADTANQNTMVYNYLALMLNGETEVAWKDTRLRMKRSTYTGDGTSTGRLIELGWEPSFVFVQQDDSARSIGASASDATRAILLAPSLLDAVQTITSVHIDPTGFTVGDGSTEGNESAIVYNYLAIAVG